MTICASGAAHGSWVRIVPSQPDTALAAVIQQNTGATYDWYSASSAGAGNDAGATRDRMTGRPLDEKGRYSQSVVLDGKMYEPKYHPCSTAECVRTGSNLDMSDPATQAYVKALDAQVFKDIGKGATVASLVTPLGVPGAALAITGTLAALGESTATGELLDGARDETIKTLSEATATSFF